MKETQCDIIIPILNRLDLTKDCLASIREFTHGAYRAILIDNGSDSKTQEFLEGFASSNSNVVLVRNEVNEGWVKAVNRGMRLSTSPYVCIMNNDTVVRTDGWLSALIEVAELEPDIGLVNPCFMLKRCVRSKKPFIEIDFCRGYCVLIKRKVVEKIGMLDEVYGFGYYDDDDYSVRAINDGFRCVRANDVCVEHLGDSTFSTIFKDEKRTALHEANKKLFYSKWGKRLRLVFVVTRPTRCDILADALISLARRQHIVYVWNVGPSLGIEHNNVRERRFTRLFHAAVFSLILFLNKGKRETKRYDMVFIDDPSLMPRLSTLTVRAQVVDYASDRDRIIEVANSLARV